MLRLGQKMSCYGTTENMSDTWSYLNRSTLFWLQSSIIAVPAVGLYMPAKQFISVDFPDPFAPSRPNTYPFGMSIETPLIAYVPEG